MHNLNDKSFGEKLADGCCSYWGMNTLLSLLHGQSNRNDRITESLSDRKFQKWIIEQKYSFENFKEIMDNDFKAKQKELTREHEYIRKEIALDFDCQKDQLKMFVKGWPLRLSLQAAQKLRTEFTGIPSSLYIVIATHTGKQGKAEDMLSRLYDGSGNIIDNVSQVLVKLDILKENILRFNRGDIPGGGAALANIYAMMSQIPTLVILPRLDRLNKILRISIGFWSPCAATPSQRTAIVLDYDELRMTNDAKYKVSKQKEIETAYIALSGVMNDLYRVMILGKQASFLNYIQHGSLDKYAIIADFVRKEYMTIVNDEILGGLICGQEQRRLLNNGHDWKELAAVVSSKHKKLN